MAWTARSPQCLFIGFTHARERGGSGVGTGFLYLNKNIRRSGAPVSEKKELLEIGRKNALGPNIDAARRSSGDEWCSVAIVELQ